ncbi:lamin tail domain-containing protein [Tenacibaculum aiptasiae]|uniref:lamin tail domain-containing protein n=1 Tax=Tenacibaculum aiptasiae TaxID=426481 RepID=UPI003B58BE0A
MNVLTVPVNETTEIINELKKQANQLLSATYGVNLEAFHVGSKGNFPFYWENSSNLKFNSASYDWIKSSIKRESSDGPVTLEGVFTNIFLETITNIAYSLSTADQAILTKAHQNAQEQQGALLRAWRAAFGTLPSGNTPINDILGTIQKDWSSKPNLTLQQIQNARDLNEELDKTPPAGAPILPVLASYLNALGSAINLENDVTLNNSILRDLRNAINNPTASNGAVEVYNSSAGSSMYLPNYPFAASSSVAKLTNSLQHPTANPITLKMSVSNFNGSDVTISVNGGAGVTIPVLDFFSISGSGHASYFKNTIAAEASQIDIEMSFSGVTLAQFGPMDYDISSRQGWLYADPIKQAMKNGDKDVSGFKFGTTESADLAKEFSFINAVAFSNFPDIKMVIHSSSYESIETIFKETTSWSVGFLGIPLGGGSQTYTSKDTQVNSSDGTITINLSAPQAVVSESADSSTGFVLGVQPEFPLM